MNALVAFLTMLGFDLSPVIHPAQLIPYIAIAIIGFGLLWCMLALLRYLLTQLFGGRLV